MDLFRDLELLWHHRELLSILTKREIVARYKQTFFGFGWSVVQPALQALVYTIAFTMILKTSGAEGVPFANFVFANLTVWTYFSATSMNAMNSLRANANIISKVSFPREIIPLATILAGLFDFFVTFLVLLIANAVAGFYPNWRFAYIPALLVVEILFILDLSLVLAVLNIVRRDISFVVSYFIMLYMFVTPVFFPVTALPKFLQEYYFLNPMGTIIDAFKNIVFYNQNPRWYALLAATLILLALFALSYRFFKKAEKTMVDVL